ncbi:MAG: beta-lactamase family protein [Oxalobacteraceae bacterium]|nr:beta-lactamase family protein [Oxalobacteraceae bacterium]
MRYFSLPLLRCVLLPISLLALSAGVASIELASGLPQSQGMSPSRLTRVHDLIQTEITENRIPGAVVLVARKGKIIYSDVSGFQDKPNGKPMTRDAIFRAYSMTKPMVSVLTMMLVEEGRLQLNDPVAKFFPAMAKMSVLSNPADANSERVPAARQITIHDLLRHTSGITYAEFTRFTAIKGPYQEAGLFSPDVQGKWITLTPQQQIDALSKAPLLWQPGSTWEYSLSTDLLGRVLEAITNQTLSALLEERLFKPLGMKDTSFLVPAAKAPRIAEPFRIDPLTGQPYYLVLDVTQPMGNDSGGAGISTTADDYLRFCQMLLNGGNFDGKRYLSRTTITLMTSDHLGPKVATPVQPGELLMGVQGYTFGLGFMVRQGPGMAGVHGSEGDYAWGGYGGTFFWIDPKEQLIGLLMSQTPGASRQYYRRMIKTLVYQAIE